MFSISHNRKNCVYNLKGILSLYPLLKTQARGVNKSQLVVALKIDKQMIGVNKNVRM